MTIRTFSSCTRGHQKNQVNNGTLPVASMYKHWLNEQVSEFLAAYSATSCMARHIFFRGGHSKDSGKGAAQKDATELRLLIEPKGKAATVATLDYLAQQVSSCDILVLN